MLVNPCLRAIICWELSNCCIAICCCGVIVGSNTCMAPCIVWLMVVPSCPIWLTICPTVLPTLRKASFCSSVRSEISLLVNIYDALASTWGKYLVKAALRFQCAASILEAAILSSLLLRKALALQLSKGNTSCPIANCCEATINMTNSAVLIVIYLVLILHTAQNYYFISI